MTTCPHCGSELGSEKGVDFGSAKRGLALSDSDQASLSKTENNQDQIETPFSPKLPVRGRAREYTEAFELAWKSYPRREQKFEAFGVWIVRAREAGGEDELLALVLPALRWQNPIWAQDLPKFVPYFERYLKRRKWEDERPASSGPAPQRQPTKQDVQIAASRRFAERHQAPAAEPQQSTLRMGGVK